MLRFSVEVTRMDRIRNEVVRGTTQTGRLGDKAREDRLRRFGHAQRRDSGDIGRRMLEMELPGRRPRGRPRRRFMDAVKEDMQIVGVIVEDTKNRLKWKTVICCGDPRKGKSHKEKKKKKIFKFYIYLQGKHVSKVNVGL